MGTREVEEVAEETAEKRKGGGGGEGGGREEAEDDDGGGGGGVLSSAIGGKTGDRERRRLSRKFGNYRCRVVFFFPFLFSPFFSTSDIDLGEAVRIRGTSIPCDSQRRCRRRRRQRDASRRSAH